jgi:predicted phage-related endonuclease
MGSKPVGISASRGAAVLGLSPYMTRVDVWAQICEDRSPGFCAAHGIVPPEPVDNAAIRWGTGFESAVIQLAEIARGMTIGNREELHTMIIKHAEMGPTTANGNEVQITCHLDGRYEDGVIHEGKTTSSFAFRDAWGEPGTDRIPRAYQVQTQHQMLCANADSAIVSVLVFPTRPEEWEAAGLRIGLEQFGLVEGQEFMISRGHDCDPDNIDTCGGPCAENGLGSFVSSAWGWARTLRDMNYFHQYPITANHELQEMMLSSYRDFWTRYVLPETPPPAETYEDIKRLLPEPRGTVVATEQQERWASEYKQIGDESAKSKKRQDQLKALLLGGIERGAEHPIDNDSVEAIVLRNRTGKKIASYAKEKSGKKVFRCGG